MQAEEIHAGRRGRDRRDTGEVTGNMDGEADSFTCAVSLPPLLRLGTRREVAAKLESTSGTGTIEFAGHLP